MKSIDSENVSGWFECDNRETGKLNSFPRWAVYSLSELLCALRVPQRRTPGSLHYSVPLPASFPSLLCLCALNTLLSLPHVKIKPNFSPLSTESWAFPRGKKEVPPLTSSVHKKRGNFLPVQKSVWKLEVPMLPCRLLFPTSLQRGAALHDGIVPVPELRRCGSKSLFGSITDQQQSLGQPHHSSGLHFLFMK